VLLADTGWWLVWLLLVAGGYWHSLRTGTGTKDRSTGTGARVRVRCLLRLDLGAWIYLDIAACTKWNE
jgi:hypothetical protein